MTSRDELLRVYTEIADIYERLGQGQMRDRFLVLAADTAMTVGQANRAEQLRRRLLQTSPHHLLKPYASFAQAIDSPDLASYVQDLRKNYPARTAEELLKSLIKEQESAERATPGSSPDMQLDAAMPILAEKGPPIYKLRGEPLKPVDDSMSLPATLPPGTRFPTPTLKPVAKAAAQPAASPKPQTKPRATAPLPRPPVPTPVAHVPAHTIETAPDDDPYSPGSWLSSLLFGLLLTAAALMLIYSLVKPFLS